MNIGIDFHDTLSYSPDFFKELIKNWSGKVYIVTGTPNKDREKTLQQLENLGFLIGRDFHDVLMGFNYERDDSITISHFKKMREHKLEMLKKHNITIFFDDNPYYVSYVKDHGIATFQTILAKSYTDQFAVDDPHFTCHLQDVQFDFLDKAKDKAYSKI